MNSINLSSVLVAVAHMWEIFYRRVQNVVTKLVVHVPPMKFDRVALLRVPALRGSFRVVRGKSCRIPESAKRRRDLGFEERKHVGRL